MESVRNESRAAEWKRAFGSVGRLVREEWADLEAAEIDATAGDLEKLVTLVAAHVDRTKVSVRLKLHELLEIDEAARASERNAEPNGALNGSNENGSAKKNRGDSSGEKREPIQVDEVIAAIRRLESFASDEAKRVSQKIIPLTETKVRQNLWVSLLMALGLGMIVGLWLNGSRRQR